VLIADLGKSGKSSDSNISQARIATSQHIGSHPNVLIVAQGERAPFVDESGRYIRLFVFAKENVGSAKTQQLVRDLRSAILPKSELAPYATFYLGGAPAQGVDLLNSIRDAIPQILIIFSLLIFIILMRAFKSALIPIKALLLDFISICAAVGVLVAMMKFGLAKQLFGTYQLPQLEVWALVFLIAILLGISMDYEVFIVSRMREAWLKGSTNSEAVISGFQETIGVVTSAALIFIGAVSGFIFGSFAGLQELGIGLVAAILIDATIIRFLLLPSAMILFGDLNWWSPKNKSRTL
jgi:RND superfamily putative drug exporter